MFLFACLFFLFVTHFFKTKNSKLFRGYKKELKKKTVMIIPVFFAPRASLKNSGGSTCIGIWSMVVEERAIPEPPEKKRYITNPTCIKLSVVSVHLCVCTLFCLSSFCLSVRPSVCLPFWLHTASSSTALKYLKLVCCGVNYENHLMTQKFICFIRIDINILIWLRNINFKSIIKSRILKWTVSK